MVAYRSLSAQSSYFLGVSFGESWAGTLIPNWGIHLCLIKPLFRKDLAWLKLVLNFIPSREIHVSLK